MRLVGRFFPRPAISCRRSAALGWPYLRIIRSTPSTNRSCGWQPNFDRHALDAADQCWVEIQARKFALTRPPRGHSFRSLDHRTGELMQRKYALSCHERCGS